MDRFEKLWEENYGRYELPENNNTSESIWDDPERFEAAYDAWEASWIDGPQP